MTAAEILALIRLITDLEPAAIQAIQALVNKLSGLTPDQIAALTIQINNTAISEIDVELAKLPPVTTTTTTVTTTVAPTKPPVP